MSVKIRRVQFDSTKLPSNVQLVIADAETAKESKVWISARFPVAKHDNDSFQLILGVGSASRPPRPTGKAKSDIRTPHEISRSGSGHP